MPQVMKEVIWWQPEDLQRFVAMAEMERRFGTVNLNTSVSLDSADDEEARPYRPTPSAPRDVVGAAGREPASPGQDQAPPLCREPGRPALSFSPRYVAADELTAAIDEAFRSRPIEELSNEPNVYLKYRG